MLIKEPLHIKISNVLRREIRRKKPGDRLESEQSLAERFGVSSLTIREALAKLAEEGVIARRHGSGTFVREKKSVIALLVAEWLFEGRGSFFFMRLAQLLRENLMRSGCDVEFHLGKFEPWAGKAVNPRWPLMPEIEKGALAGVIAICVEPPLAWVEYALAKGIACVSGGDRLPCSVTSDSRQMIREGVRFIRERGRKSIAFFQWNKRTEQEERDGLFLRPFIDALAEYGLPYRREWVFGALRPDEPASDWQTFQALWKTDVLKPDSILVSDDVLYREVAMALLCAGVRVPDEALVVTHANRGSDIIYPFPTARMEYDPRDFANAMVDMVLHHIREAEISPETIVIPFRWVGVENIR